MKPRLPATTLALVIVNLSIALLFSHCHSEDSSKIQVQRLSHTPIPAQLAKDFSGDKAFAHAEQIVSFGPRPPASPGFEKTLKYLEQQLAEFGWTSTRQSFRAATPDGPTRFTNLLARHSSAPLLPASVPVVIGGHIDSKKLSFPFVGANDGASSTAILLELARCLASDPASAAGIELVFFDGEEAFRPGISATDGLYGSKYYAHELSTRSDAPALGIVLDIVGDPNFTLHYGIHTSETFQRAIQTAATEIPFRMPLSKSPAEVIDDHIPLQTAGLPCLHLIGDFSSMSYWHQPDDTLDKITPAMLQNVGQLTLLTLSQALSP